MPSQSFVYILCFGEPRRVRDADMPSNEKRMSPPVSHYVGFTMQDRPTRRALKDHHANIDHLVYLAPGDLKNEEDFKRNGRCPRCGGSLDYHAEARRSPEWSINRQRIEEWRRLRRTERQKELDLFNHEAVHFAFELGAAVATALVHENSDDPDRRRTAVQFRIKRAVKLSDPGYASAQADILARIRSEWMARRGSC
jgi:rRNA maturation protein Nop10